MLALAIIIICRSRSFSANQILCQIWNICLDEVLILSNHFLFFVNDFLSVIKSDEVLIPSNHSYLLFLGTEVLVLNDHFLFFLATFCQ